jgi:HD-GYP domain-containing protein (c-di-GMP phosphodiesterase class II)
MDFEDNLINDFFDEYTDAQESIEKTLVHWERFQTEADLNTLFTYVHSVKSNLRMMQLNELSETIHYLEDLLAQLRNHEKTLKPGFTILISCTLERCKVLARQFFAGNDISDAILLLNHKLTQLASISSNDFSYGIYDAVIFIDQMGDYGPNYNSHKLLDYLDSVDTKVGNQRQGRKQAEEKTDLVFFQELIQQIENYFPYWKGRSQKILQLADQMNQAMKHIINDDQLKAAVYMHDLGMNFLPPQKFYIAKNLTSEDKTLIQQHCETGYYWLSKISGWHEAAIITLQHHERYDGTGYPYGLKGSEIHPGAKILAICDAYVSIIHHNKKGAMPKAVLNAIKEINEGAGTQFDPIYVNIFNTELRRLRPS